MEFVDLIKFDYIYVLYILMIVVNICIYQNLTFLVLKIKLLNRSLEILRNSIGILKLQKQQSKF